MTRATALLLCAALLAACAGGVPPPEWQLGARQSMRSYQDHYFDGRTAIAEREFARARSEVTRTGRPDLIARIELARCAMRTASLDLDECPAFEALRADAAPAELAYASYLRGDWSGLDASLLPEHHVAVVAGGGAALADIRDPLAALVAAGALLRAKRIAPADVERAIAIASAQGWRRPLRAWLGLALLAAENAGDAPSAAKLRRRIELIDSRT